MPISLTATHIGTATVLLTLNSITFLTDPVFDPAGTNYDVGRTILKKHETPAPRLKDLPSVDAILLSHEDHSDNLDPSGRTLLNGRIVLTTPDGAKNLAPRPGVHALKPWEMLELKMGGKDFKVTGTPCKHVPGGEVVGFIVESADFGTASDGRPNAIYFSGDTVYIEDLKKIKDKWHIAAAIFNWGNAKTFMREEVIKITLDGKDAVQLFKDIGADVLIPIHFEGWEHFTQSKDALEKDFKEGGIEDKVRWLTPGKPTKVL
ncbi:hypothetical protein M422DRAFT_261478 [Sphaerobolus stellatus SS14]|uniref:Metallo-beta-lactamase domain-containing protein n=1 Tax=Sphaerobolus stellatus (strain SS14) TaxID=990650 RepID=A0A0C9VFF6_SPHS4|nr:hypothetical protein M422DRAFT_261478 [Sphaerobolus stellatus SS14]